MKLKALALVAAVLMTASCFAACSNNASSDTSDTSSETNTSNDSSSDAEVSLEHNQIEITSTPVTDLDYLATSEDTSEAVELIWYQWGDPQTDGDTVYEKLNEMSSADINTTVQYLFTDDTKAGLIISTDEYYDIMFSCSWQANYINNANKGVFAHLEEILPTVAPTLYNFTPELVWQGATVNGHIDMIPVYKDSAAAQMWAIDADLFEQAGITMEEFDAVGNDWDKMTPILQKLKDNTDLEGVEAPYMYNDILTLGLEFDYINRNSGGIGIPYDATDNKVVSLLSTEEAVSKAITNKYWLDNGLRNADSLTAESSWTPVYYAQGWVNCEAFWENNDHGSVVISTCVPAVYTTDSIVGSGNAISINSDHIERSLLFLQWINCNSEARDIFCYGVEGVHWNKTAEGTAERTEAGNTGYRPGNFAQGTFFTETPEAPKSLDSWDGLLESCMNAMATPLLGFTPDNSAIENELAATNMIWSQYSRAFMVGATENPEAELAAALTELEAAGLNTIIDEYQAQVDEFLASK